MYASKTVVAAVVGVAALAGCKPLDVQQSESERSGTANGNVVITTSMNRSGEQETHYVECAATTAADTGDYRIAVSGQVAYRLDPGQPCPAGEAEPMPQDEHPELYAEMSAALYAPAPYEGGDINTCGEWEADDPADARQMLAECPPLTKGDLP